MSTPIPLDLVRANPDQPRKIFDPAKLDELAESIRSNRLMQPITVRPMGDEYQIVMGERRWRAHLLLRDRGHLPTGTIDAEIREMDDIQRDVEAIVENFAREGISPMEEARAFKRMIDAGMTVPELAQRLGMQQAWRITDRLRLFNLAPEFMAMFEGGQLAAEAVYEISRLESHADQTRVIQAINRGQITGYKAVRAAVAAIMDGLAQTDIFGKDSERAKASDDELAQVRTMEQKVDMVAGIVKAGFKDGEVVVARKVAPDKAQRMADQLRLIRSHVLMMENQLREAAAQSAMVH